MKESLLEIFRDEAGEQLTVLESALLELGCAEGDPELVNAVFRPLHTIKGSAAMFGLDEISVFAHRVESVLDLVRSGELSVSQEMITLVFRACDIIRKMIFASSDDYSDEACNVTNTLMEIARQVAPPADDSTERPESPTVVPGVRQTFRITLLMKPSVLKQGVNPLEMLRELALLGTCTSVANLDAIPPLQEIDPHLCYVDWEITLTTTAGENAVRDIFIFIEDQCTLAIDEITAGKAAGDSKSLLGEILVRRGDLERDHLERILSRKKRLGEMLLESGAVPEERLNAALSEQSRIRGLQRDRQLRESTASLRVPAIKLDKLMNLVGELVTSQGRLSLCSNDFNSIDLSTQRDFRQIYEQWDAIGEMLRDVAEETERLTVELRESVMGMRMLPIGSIFGRLGRLVRDLATELGKDVVMVTEGEDTELDKTFIERLVDPLLHIIRNSMDHGIETREKRLASGKPVKGVIRFVASHTGESVEIIVSDDGAGLDSESIRSTAVSRGLIPPDANLEDKELFALICEPGFSTSREVTAVSGRGVGMDVVMQAITDLNGSLEIRSVRGSGTAMTIKLPLTLAIIETLLVKVGGERYMIPLNQVEECIDFVREGDPYCSSNIATLRGASLPFIPLRARFSISGESPRVEQIVVARNADYRFGLLVDEVICQYQAVIKPLGKFYGSVKGVSGATVMGDGKLALVLDLPALLSMEEGFDPLATGSVHVASSILSGENYGEV